MLRPWSNVYCGWEATITTRLQAGADKDAFAARLHRFLTADGYPVSYSEHDNEFDW